MQQDHNGNRRLDSWKEIAAHLGRNERTAIRWEKNGLPVHRVPGGQRQAVFAYTAEIDKWLLSQDGKETHSDLSDEVGSRNDLSLSNPQKPESANTITADSVGAATHFPKWIWLTAVLSLAGLGWAAFSFTHAHSSAATLPVRFSQLTSDGRFRVYVRTDGSTLYMNEFDGTRATLVSMPVSGGPTHPVSTPFASMLLQDLSADGQNLLLTPFEGAQFEEPLWVMPARGGVGHRVGSISCQYARWSPDNSKIACAAGTTITLLDS